MTPLETGTLSGSTAQTCGQNSIPVRQIAVHYSLVIPLYTFGSSTIKGILMELHSKEASGRKHMSPQLDDATEHIESVFSPIERQSRLIAANLILQCIHFGTGDVWRVGDEDIERGEKVGVDLIRQIALDHGDPLILSVSGHVATCEVRSFRRDVGRDDREIRIRSCRRDRQRDASRSSPDLQDASASLVIQNGVELLEYELYEHFGLGARDEHSLLSTHHDPMEGDFTSHVLQRLTFGAAAYSFAEDIALLE